MKKLLQLIPLLLLVTLAMAQTQHGRITQRTGVGDNTFDGILFYSGTTFLATLDHSNTAARVYFFPDTDTTIVGTDVSQTLTNKTIASPIFNVQITLDQTTADYTLTWADPAVASALTIPDPGATGTFVFLESAQTFSGAKTFSNNVVVSSSIASGGGANPETLTIQAVDAITPGASGSNLLLNAGDGDSDPTLGGIGGDIIATAGDGQTVGNRRGGDIVLDPGAGVGTARNGRISIENGVNVDGGGFKHKRNTEGCATAATTGASCDVTITWSTAFADANYSVNCDGLDITSGVPVDGGIHTQVAASVQFRTVAVTAVAAEFDKVVCSAAVHD